MCFSLFVCWFVSCLCHPCGFVGVQNGVVLLGLVEGTVFLFFFLFSVDFSERVAVGSGI